MALSAAYFVNELKITNLSGSSYAEVENLAALTWMIKKHEVMFLKLMLGDNLYAKYAAAITLAPASGIWHDLNDLIYQESSPLYQSPVANYVYFKFWKTNATTTTGTGESVAKVENSDSISIGPKMVAAWNEMVDMIIEIRTYLNAHTSDYVDWGTEDIEEFNPITLYGC